MVAVEQKGDGGVVMRHFDNFVGLDAFVLRRKKKPTICDLNMRTENAVDCAVN
jgi:hypothetical protein